MVQDQNELEMTPKTTAGIMEEFDKIAVLLNGSNRQTRRMYSTTGYAVIMTAHRRR
jgi:hypothetical protein